MNLPKSRSERLREMISLEEKRGGLKREIDSIEEQLGSLHSGLSGTIPPAAPSRQTASPASKLSGWKHAATAAPRASRKPARKASRKRGALKESIYSALEAAGDIGVRVKDLASSMGINPVNVHSWFHSTSKRNPSIIKLSGGHYRLDARGSRGRPSAAARRPKAGRRTVKSKASGTRRGALAEQILGALREAGKKGSTIKELANKIGAKYRNIAIWFSTTGKKYSSVRKIAPAHFQLTS